MRILHCTDTYPPQVNGVSVVTALALDGLLQRGVEVALVAPRYPRTAPMVFGASRTPSAQLSLPACDFPPYPGLRLALPQPVAVERFARDFQPDLVHADTEFVVGRLGARAARRLGVPLVTSFHTDFAQYTESYGVPWLRGPVTRSLQRFHRSAARIYTPSSVTAGWLEAHGLPHAEVWGRAVDVHVFNPSRRSTTWREQLKLGNAVVFLHVGRLAAEKNVDLLLQGFAAARERLGDRAQLVIAGDGPSTRALRDAAPPGTHFVGFIDRQHDLPALYASADAFLCASMTETLGLVILEAMASGLPVGAVAAGGVADHLRHEENGLAFAPNATAVADAIVRLTADAELRRRLGTGARAWAEAIRWDRELDRLVESYDEVIGRAGGGAPVTNGLHATTQLSPWL
ncbi:MAG: glycosyltransferase family 1 protein [Gemmatimonadetes bacterium]|nr:glycosyltransferase family 1 protein [Gemmatimonadota bacterium]